jgi:hypothetical protein
MLLYLSSNHNSDLFDFLMNEHGILVKKLSGEFQLKNFVIRDMRNFSHCSFVAFDLKALKDTEDEIMNAIIGFRSMYDSRIIVLAVGRDTKDEFLSNLYSEGIRNLITAQTVEDIRKEILECVSEDGMSYDKALPYQCEIEDESTIENKLVLPSKYIFNCKGVKIAVSGTAAKSGTTTTAMNLAHFLADTGARVSYLEANKNNHIAMLPFYYKGIVERDGFLEYKSVKYYTTRIKYDFSDFNFNIIDVGVLLPEYLEIFKKSDIRILCSTSKSYELEARIQTFGDVRTDTDVIFNVVAYNTGDKDIIPSDNVKVSFTAAGRTQESLLIVPQNSSQVIPFKVGTPSVAGVMTLTASVDSTNVILEISESNNESTKTVNVYKPVIPDISDPKADDVRPVGWVVPPVPSTVADKCTTWTEWRYDSGSSSFSRVQFYIETSTDFTIIPDTKIHSYKSVSGEYITKSGYGVETYVTVEVTTNYDRMDLIIPAQRVWVYTPESGYNLFRELDLGISGLTTSAVFYPNKYSTYNARLHFTPVWYPDGYYTMHARAIDIWTPAGEIATAYSSSVTIDGSVYDDWHIGPFR